MKRTLFIKSILVVILAFITYCNASQYHNFLCDQQNNPRIYTLADFKDTPYVHQHDAFEFHKAVETQLSTTLAASVNVNDQPTAFAFLMSTMIYGQMFYLMDTVHIEANLKLAISVLNSPTIDTSKWFEICQISPSTRGSYQSSPLTQPAQLLQVRIPKNNPNFKRLMDTIKGIRNNAFSNLWVGLYETINNQIPGHNGNVLLQENDQLIYAASAYLAPALNILSYCQPGQSNSIILREIRKDLSYLTQAKGPLTWVRTEQEKNDLKKLLTHFSLLHPITWHFQQNTFPMPNNTQKLFDAFTHNDAETAIYACESELTLFQSVEQLKTQDEISKLTLSRKIMNAILPIVCNSTTCYIAY